MGYITSTKQAAAMAGKFVYWDDLSIRYRFLRRGLVVSASNGIIEFESGNLVSISDLKKKALRDFPNGGDFKDLTEHEAMRCLM